MARLIRPRFTEEQHKAFAAALMQLYVEWPLQADDHYRRKGRMEFYDMAARGLYAVRQDWIPVGQLAVPTEQLFAIHTLIYG